MSIYEDLSIYGCQIRPYADALSNGYAVVIPFENKEDCLTFCKRYRLNIEDISDDIPANIPLGLFQEAMDYMDNLKQSLPKPDDEE